MTRRVTGMMVAVLALGAGCAKQPATMTASGPAPTGAGASTRPGAPPTAAATSRPQAPPSGAAQSGARPAPKDFTAVADLVDVHFAFDKYDIRPDAARVLEANARLLNARGTAQVLIEGHCDERGTGEYNLALGERRARAAMNALAARGVDTRRITVVSYGEDRPQCRDLTEACWAKNRRAHFKVKER